MHTVAPKTSSLPCAGGPGGWGAFPGFLLSRSVALGTPSRQGRRLPVAASVPSLTGLPGLRCHSRTGGSGASLLHVSEPRPQASTNPPSQLEMRCLP